MKKTAAAYKAALASAKPKRVVILSSWGAEIKERAVSRGLTSVPSATLRRRLRKGAIYTVSILEEELAHSADEVVFVRATGSVSPSPSTGPDES